MTTIEKIRNCVKRQVNNASLCAKTKAGGGCSACKYSTVDTGAFVAYVAGYADGQTSARNRIVQVAKSYRGRLKLERAQR